MPIKRLDEFPTGSGSLTNDDLFIFMDDPASGGVTKKITLSQLSSIVGGDGVMLNTSGIIDPTLLAVSGEPNSQTFLRGDSKWVDMVSPANLQLRYGTYAEASGITPLQGEPIWITDKKILRIGDGETLGGYSIDIKDSDSYVICKPGDSIQDKYAEARNLTPNKQSLSSSNRAYFIIMPGKYTWGDPDTYTVTINGFDTPYIDILGIGSYVLDRGCLVSVEIDTTAFASAFPVENNINIKGIKTSTGFGFQGGANVIENCDLQNSSMTTDSFTKITNCNNVSIEICDGVYVNCLGSFSNPIGKFVNCQSDNNGFVDINLNNGDSGQFISCIGGDNSFHSKGTFTNCVAGSGSFKRDELDANFDPLGLERTRGRLFYCRLTSGNFATIAGGGVIRYCINGSLSGVNLP